MPRESLEDTGAAAHNLSLPERLRERWSSRTERNPVHSLAWEAAQARAERPPRSQFQVLVGHIFARFFDGDMLSLEGDTQTRVIQTAAAVAVPGLFWAMARIASYHQPLKKPFWAQAGDQYFYIVYSFVAMGAVAVFEWDLLFPDLLDCQVLTTLPIQGRTLFTARVSALALLLGIFLFATNFLGSIFLCLWYWSMAKSAEVYSPGYFGHLGPHLAAVSLSGIFAVALVFALQGVLISVLGEGWFRRISAGLQSILVTLFLIVLFVFPILPRFLPALLESGSAAVRWFPPFWFLGVEERLLYGSSVQSIFRELARSGCWATMFMGGLAAATYPIAYRRKMRRTMEGAPAKRKGDSLAAAWLNKLLHCTVLRSPAKRATYHFISQTLLRIQRHRLYLAMYAGLGLSLVLSAAVALRLAHHRVALVLSPYGLRSAIPVIAFWTVSGLRTALVSPIDSRGSWVFRAIAGRPSLDHLAGSRLWVLIRAVVVTGGAIAIVRALAPSEFQDMRAIATQCIAGFGLCLLLVDAFFVNVMTAPFTEPRSASKNTLAFILVGYIAIFPPLVWETVDLEPWLKAGWIHLTVAAIVIVALHMGLGWMHRRKFTEQARIAEGYDEEEFPQTLGLL